MVFLLSFSGPQKNPESFGPPGCAKPSLAPLGGELANIYMRSLIQLAATRAAAGFSPQSGSTGGGLTATYYTPNAKTFSTR